MKNSRLKFLGWIALSFCAFFISACGSSPGDPASELRFAVITDTHVDALQPFSAFLQKPRKSAPEDILVRFRRLLDVLKKEKVDFVVITGDIVNFLSRANVLALKEEIARSGLKVFRVPGNHDRDILDPSQEISERTRLEGAAPGKALDWETLWKNAGENAKSSDFTQKGYCFIFLDNSSGLFDDDSINKASVFLDQNPDCRVFVFFHKPLKMPNESRQAAKRYGPRYAAPSLPGKYDIVPPSPIFPFLERYGGRIEAVFSGHIHSRAKDKWKNQFDQFVLESGTETGAYALVKCKNSEGCDTSILKAGGVSPRIGGGM